MRTSHTRDSSCTVYGLSRAMVGGFVTDQPGSGGHQGLGHVSRVKARFEKESPDGWGCSRALD